MTLDQLVWVLTVMSLGLLFIMCFKFKVILGIAGGLLNGTLIWLFLEVIHASNDPTMSNPIWFAIYALGLIGGLEFLAAIAKLFGSQNNGF